MEENLVQISQTLQSLSNTSALDWFSVIAPILLSVVAICISISTSRKQNKIALFEKRYEIYVNLNQLLKAKTYFKINVIPEEKRPPIEINHGLLGDVLNVDLKECPALPHAWVKEINRIHQIAESSKFVFTNQNSERIINIHSEIELIIETY